MELSELDIVFIRITLGLLPVVLFGLCICIGKYMATWK